MKERIFTAIWIYALFFASYTFANQTVSIESAADLTISLDRLIPFIPEFVYPFYLLYGFIVLPSFLIRKRVLLYRTAASFSALIVLSVIIFIVFPVYVPRPEFTLDSFAGKLVFSIYQMDRPVCGFPSLHVSASLLATLAVYRNSRIQGVLFFALFFLTSAATLFIKQHVILDAVGGIVMALLMDFLFIGDKGLSIRPFLKGLRLMVLTAGQSPNKTLSETIHRRECVTADGTRYDLYDPVKPAARTFIVIHGVTLQGEKDERLVDFSEKLAASGIRVAAISLPGLKECRFDSADTQAICDLAAALSGMYGGKVGIIGFSFGAGLALVAAARPEGSHLIDPMILFGPYYSLKSVQTETAALLTRPPVTEAEWNNYIWIRLVNVYQRLNDLDLEKDIRQKICDMLTNYCHESSLEVKRDFYETTLKHIHLNKHNLDTLSESVADALSPKNKLRDIQGRVFLIHDSHDILIPAHHSQAVFQELKNSSGLHNHKLLITPLLSHVTPRTAFKALDIFSLINIFAKIYA